MELLQAHHATVAARAGGDDRPHVDTDREIDGVVETADPATGVFELMGYWLPPGVTATDLGLERVLTAAEVAS